MQFSPHARVGLGFDLPPHLHKGLCDFIARESLDGRQVMLDDLIDDLINDALDKPERYASLDQRPEIVIELDDEETPHDDEHEARRTRRLNAKPAALAAAAARNENLTYREAAARFDVSHEAVRWHFKRLYPNEQRSMGPRDIQPAPPSDTNESNAPRRARGPRPGGEPSDGEIAARAAHDEGLSFREAGARFNIAMSVVGYHFRRLYPGEREQGRRPAAPTTSSATEWDRAIDDHRQARRELEQRVEPEFVAPPHDSTDVIAIAADLRERIDALDIEIKEWEQLRAELDRRIARNLAESIVLKERLAAARRERAA